MKKYIGEGNCGTTTFTIFRSATPVVRDGKEELEAKVDHWMWLTREEILIVATWPSGYTLSYFLQVSLDDDYQVTLYGPNDRGVTKADGVGTFSTPQNCGEVRLRKVG